MPIDRPVYVVDDDAGIREWLGLLLDEHGIRHRAFADGAQFIEALDDLEPGCILLDMRMPRRGGLEVQAELARRDSIMPVIAITGYGDVPTAVQSMKLGALDLLEKPLAPDLVLDALEAGMTRLREAHA